MSLSGWPNYLLNFQRDRLGEDKPLKYPTMFKSAQAVVISKIDLAAAVEFNREEALRHIHQIAPQALTFELSAKTGQGMGNLSAYLRQAIADCKQNSQSADLLSSYQERF